MLTALLKYSLFEGPVPEIPATFDWNKFFVQCRKEAVVALAYDAICKLPKTSQPPHDILFHFATITHTIEEDFLHFAQATAELQESFSDRHPECGLRPIPVVKGLRIAGLYPTPQHREFGDIDLLSGKYTDLLINQLEEAGIDVDLSDRRHPTFQFRDIHFEAHRYLFYKPEENEYFDSVRGKDGLTLELHAHFIAAHIERHAVFFNEGIMLKMLTDWTLLWQKIDRQKYEQYKGHFETSRFANLLTCYCCHLFGLPSPTFNDYTPSSKAISAFSRMFCLQQQRHSLALFRVLVRCYKYCRYNALYKEVYGQSMFKRFYIHNLKTALSQLIKHQPRESRHHTEIKG